ncbi:uncharacterized protein [Onthophagus taurus]|uniref:uncharacterized protein n=1 Tax=Onthophagus taurus TaxID=166361 RepID=UPI0039BE7EEF
MDCVIVMFFACFNFLPIIKSQDDYYSRPLQAYSSYNEHCISNKDCRPFGYICKNNKTCDCDRMYSLDVYKTQCVGGVDQKCIYDEHCIIGAFCMNQAICKCKETTPVILENGMVCAKSNKMKNCEKSWVLLPFIIAFLK